jgi:hypothetical protein
MKDFYLINFRVHGYILHVSFSCLVNAYTLMMHARHEIHHSIQSKWWYTYANVYICAHTHLYIMAGPHSRDQYANETPSYLLGAGLEKTDMIKLSKHILFRC